MSEPRILIRAFVPERFPDHSLSAAEDLSPLTQGFTISFGTGCGTIRLVLRRAGFEPHTARSLTDFSVPKYFTGRTKSVSHDPEVVMGFTVIPWSSVSPVQPDEARRRKCPGARRALQSACVLGAG